MEITATHRALISQNKSHCPGPFCGPFPHHLNHTINMPISHVLMTSWSHLQPTAVAA